MASDARTAHDVVETDIPARMDRLPWSRWHWLVVVALGITWVLDGLEVTIVGAIGAILTNKHTLALSDAEVGLAGAVYVAGNVVGAFLFGYLTDRLGRKRLFTWTLGLYLAATVATAFSWNVMSFFVFRFITGMGIGGEYSAINSATEELNPARVRGWVELGINGSWWVGTAVGAASSILLLNKSLLPVDIGWRVAFGLGALLGIGVLLIRRLLPESPRWLMTHGRVQEAEGVVADIEDDVRRYTGREQLPDVEGTTIKIRPRERTTIREVLRSMFVERRRRVVLGLGLMVGQTFLYNAVFFTFAITLDTFFKVPAERVGWYILPFAVGNFLGPLTIGRLFDTVGRRAMISTTYVLSAIGVAITGYLFTTGTLGAWGLTMALSFIFFLASAGASAGYLTVSEIFPLEIRALAIAFFYAIGSAIGGVAGPYLFGALVETGKEANLFIGYALGAGLMLLGGVMEAFMGVDAEQRSLEEVAEPLSSEGVERGDAA
ncbi:MAG TPA: MFS transporter [Actinomycetota bacterium]|nr:MFS transporter [Actinomycetota bacterium]